MAAKSPTVQLCEQVSFALAWRVPWLMHVTPFVTYHEEPGIPTLDVDLKGRIRVNPEYFGKLSPGQQRAALIHEYLHPTLRHHARKEGRNALVAGPDGRPYPFFLICADMAINAIIARLEDETKGWIAVSHDWVFPPDAHEDKSAEELYDILLQEAQKSGGAPTDGGNGEDHVPIGRGCGTRHADGGEGHDHGEGAAEGQSESQEQGQGQSQGQRNLERRWAEIAGQVQHAAKECGTGAGQLAAHTLAMPPAKVRWEAILRHGMSQAQANHGREDLTWRRRNRRTGPTGPIFPGSIGYKATACVVVDGSGSMFVTDANGVLAVNQAISEVEAVVTATGVPTLLVVHDDGVCKGTPVWIRPGTKAPNISKQALQAVGGGTSFGAAYQAVRDAGKKFDVMIHLTDGGVGHWPDRPTNCKKLIVALLGFADGRLAPTGAKVIDARL